MHRGPCRAWHSAQPDGIKVIFSQEAQQNGQLRSCLRAQPDNLLQPQQTAGCSLYLDDVVAIDNVILGRREIVFQQALLLILNQVASGVIADHHDVTVDNH